MIKLYQFESEPGLPNFSPPCMKLECFLRMAQLSFEIVPVSDPRKGPKGKCPFIDDGDVRMGDSELIIDYLQNKHEIELDAGLSDEQRAVSRAFQILMDERLYWTIVYNRWMDEENFPKIKERFFGKVPTFLRGFIWKMASKNIKRQLWGHGIGRHTQDEIYGLGKADVAAIAAYLGDKPFMQGDKATRVDASAIAYIANVLTPPFTGPVKDEAERHPQLKAYCDRMMAAYFA